MRAVLYAMARAMGWASAFMGGHLAERYMRSVAHRKTGALINRIFRNRG